MNRGPSRWMEHCPFQEVAQPAPQAKVCVEACSPCFYRRKSRRKGFNENSFYKGGGGESNQIRCANVLAGENSKSIAPQGNKAIKMFLRGDGEFPRQGSGDGSTARWTNCGPAFAWKRKGEPEDTREIEPLLGGGTAGTLPFQTAI